MAAHQIGDVVVYVGSMVPYRRFAYRVVNVPDSGLSRGYVIEPASKSINEAINERLGQLPFDENQLMNVSALSLIDVFDVFDDYGPAI